MAIDIEQRLLEALSLDLEAVPEPYARLAKHAGFTEEELFEEIKKLMACGKIRRFGAIVRHDRAGIEGNIMVCWKVPEDKIDELGPIMAGAKGVSHCYQRPTMPDFPYNVYTMVHGHNMDEAREVVKRIEEATGLKERAELPTRQGFKKTSPTYARISGETVEE